MNEAHGVNWEAVFAIVGIIELAWTIAISLIAYVFIRPLRDSAKKIDSLDRQITTLNLTPLRESVNDHERRMRDLEQGVVRQDNYNRDHDSADRERRIMNKKLDILLQRTARLAHPVEERELTDEG